MARKEIGGLICDLDGTLVDTEEYHIQAWAEILGKYGFAFSKGQERKYVGASDEALAEYCVKMLAMPVAAADLLRERNILYRQLLMSNRERIAFPGVAEELEELRRMGLRMAVATNSPMENTLVPLMLAGIETYFPTLITLGMGGRPKPAPDPFVHAAQSMAARPGECVVVEDTPIGVRAGKAAGAYVLGLLTTAADKDMAEADALFASTRDALAWIRNNCVVA